METYRILAVLANKDASFTVKTPAKDVMSSFLPVTEQFSLEVSAPSEMAALDVVFARLNHGSGQEAEGYTLRSLSVGDVLVVNSCAYLCAPCGWDRLQ